MLFSNGCAGEFKNTPKIQMEWNAMCFILFYFPSWRSMLWLFFRCCFENIIENNAQQHLRIHQLIFNGVLQKSIVRWNMITSNCWTFTIYTHSFIYLSICVLRAVLCNWVCVCVFFFKQLKYGVIIMGCLQCTHKK